MQDIVKKILDGGDVRTIISEGSDAGYSVSSKCLSDLHAWWRDIVTDWASSEGEDADSEYVTIQTDLVLPQDLVFFGDIAGNTFSVDQFKDLIGMSGISVPDDVELSKDDYSGGVKVRFTGISPDEFADRVI